MKILEKIFSLFKTKKKVTTKSKETIKSRAPRSNSEAKTENISHRRMPSSKDVDRTVQKAKVAQAKTIQPSKNLTPPISSTETMGEKKKPKRYY